MHDEIEFNGKIYKRYPNGKHPNYFYWKYGRRCKGTSLHRAVWEYYNGEIPKGYDIHHIDGNPLNNSIENLSCVSKSEHQKIHYKDKLGSLSKEQQTRGSYTKENWPERRKKALATAQERRGICAECGKPFKLTNVHQKFFP